MLRKHRRGLSPFLRSTALEGVVIIAFLVGIPSQASAHHTPIRFSPPYFGLVASASTYHRLNGCGVNTSEPLPLVMNNTTGQVSGKLRASATPRTSCGTGGIAYELADISVISPNITVNSGGLYVLRDVWWFHWIFNYSLHLANNPGRQGVQSGAYFNGAMSVYDLSTNATLLTSGVFFSSTGYSSMNASGSVRENQWLSFPMVAALTRGQTYQVEFSLSVVLYAGGALGHNSAHASLDFGTAGRAMALQAITVK